MDWVYFLYGISGLLIFICLIVSVVAQTKVYNAYNEYTKISSSLNMTGAQLAEKLALEHGLKLKIKTCKGKLTDHYNPTDKSLNISSQNYNSNSIASLAIVAHEFGHALQDAQSYKPLKLRQIAIKVSNFASGMLLPLIIISVILSIFVGFIGLYMLLAICVVYGLAVVVNLITLPVETNASARAKEILFAQIADPEEQAGITKMLSAAAMTYLASLLVSIVYFLRFLLIFLLSSRRD